MKRHIGDNVLVTTGKYRKKTGKVIRVQSKHRKIVVEKINMRTKHIKKTRDLAGQKITYEALFPAANVMVICPHCSKPTRVGHLILKDGAKQRVCKKCKQSLDQSVERKKR